MKFRKLLVLSSAVACALSLGSCDKKNDEAANQNSSAKTGTSVNVGMGYHAYVEGNQLSVIGAMVAFDSTGKVAGSRIDAIQIDYEADEADAGLVLAPKAVSAKRDDGYVKTKLEKGKDYGMLAAWGSQLAEVDAQIEAYAAWTVGKTAAEIAAAQVYEQKGVNGHKEDGYFTNDSTLFASCTITVDGFAKAIQSAYANKSAEAYTVSEGFKVGIAMNGGIAYNYGNPSHEISVDMAGTVVANGKVEAAAIDAVVASYKTTTVGEGESAVTTLNFHTEGEGESAKKIYEINTAEKYHAGSTEAEVKFLSKKVLKDAYAMKATSAKKGVIEGGAEWYEQAAAMEAGVVGKTAAEIKPMKKTDFSGATITVDSYVSALARAAEYAVLEHVGPQRDAA